MLQHESEHAQRQDDALALPPAHEEAAPAAEPQQQPAAQAAPPAASFEALTGQQQQQPQEQVQTGQAALEPAGPKTTSPPEVDSSTVSDTFVEQLAHGMAYKVELSEADEKYLADHGYKAMPPVEGQHQFFMRRFMPLQGGKPPIVCFRGTVPSKVDTLIADVDPSGIGMYQFNPNKQMIEAQMQAAASAGKVISAGHSLGGALAQIAAATFPGLVDRIVTFQAPGVSREMAKKIVEHNEQHPDEAIESSHHRVANDLVPVGGQALTPGTVHNHEMVGGSRLSRNPLAAHVSYPLANEAVAQGEQVPNVGDPHGMQATGDAGTDQVNADKSQIAEYARQGLGHLIFGAGALVNGAANLGRKIKDGVTGMFE